MLFNNEERSTFWPFRLFINNELWIYWMNANVAALAFAWPSSNINVQTKCKEAVEPLRKVSVIVCAVYLRAQKLTYPWTKASFVSLPGKRKREKTEIENVFEKTQFRHLLAMPQNYENIFES